MAKLGRGEKGVKSEKWERGKGMGAPSGRGTAVARCQGCKKLLVREKWMRLRTLVSESMREMGEK